ncbi:MAG: hypothetical protein KBD19_03175 [Candidatus Moranbacteria bacterium]|nr:hypothetical protein [Candidatus Moranbacteria bacterium]
MENYKETLKQAGLTDAQAEVYETLLSHGKQPAGALTRKTSLKRGLVYKALDELVGFGLAEKEEKPGEVAKFSPKHPSAIRDLVENRERKLKEAAQSLEGIFPTLVSNFNLSSGGPGIQVFEGKDGVEKVLNDSLSSKTIIYTYADIESVVKNIDAINRRYAARRDKLGIDKKAILLDTPFAREYMKNYHRLVTDIKLVSVKDAPPFQSALEIYDGKVAYITFAPEKMIGVIIHDPSLYALHKYMFEAMWEKTTSYSSSSDKGQETGDKENEREGEKKAAPEKPAPMEEAKYDDDEYFVRL